MAMYALDEFDDEAREDKKEEKKKKKSHKEETAMDTSWSHVLAYLGGHSDIRLMWQLHRVTEHCMEVTNKV